MKITTTQALELKNQLKKIPDIRKAQGKRHSILSVLSLAICALLSGCNSFTSIGEFAKRSSQNLLKRLGCYFHKDQQRYLAPSEATIRRILQSLEPSILEPILNDWLRRMSPEETDEAIAIDGKTLKGTRSGNTRPSHMLSAVLHEQGLTIAQVAVDKKSNEIPALRTLLDPLDIKGRIVTLDALHTQKNSPIPS